MTHRDGSALLALCATALLALRPGVAWAGTDYDPSSDEWNGARELVRVAGEAGVELQPVNELDWGRIRRGQGILVLYPRASLGLNDLWAFLDEGGRVAWLDDFGHSREFLEWFRFRRTEAVEGIPHATDLPELLVARPRVQHALTEGVDALVTNIPVALSHPSLTPVYEFAGRGQGFLLVGEIGQGKLVVAGDPSVLINTMMRFPGNRRFGRDLLEFLAARRGRRVTLVWGDVRVRGIYRGRARPRTRAREAVNTLNEAFVAATASLAEPAALRPFALVLGLSAACAMALVMWGRRPSERYGPRGPEGAAAGVAERVALFAARRANMLYPTLVARRYFEAALLRAAGLRPPTDVRAVLERVGANLDTAQRAEVRALLVELDALGVRADEGSGARVSVGRFLSLWNRIGAILSAVGG